jgi:hypothetical protein
MRGYKLMESNMTCKGFQYEIGKEYSLEGKLRICENGFHFCENPFDCLEYYDNIESDKRLFLVEAFGEVITGGNKSVTNKIKIIEEIKDIEKFFGDNIYKYVFEDNIFSKYQKLSEEFIEKHCDKIDWFWVSKYQKLSESFIEKHYDKVYWGYISGYQKLSEEFIEKHYDKVYWGCISKCQTLSKEFRQKHKNKII